MIDATASVLLQRWTGIVVKLCDQPIDLLIRPIVEQIGVGQLWERGFHCNGLFDGTLFDAMAVIRCEVGEAQLESVSVEEGDWERAHATAVTAEPAGNFTEQGGGCPLEPVIGFLIERRGVGRRQGCHGRSLHIDGEIDDELAFG